MIKLQIAPNGNQTLTKVCNICGCHIDNLTTDDIVVKKPDISDLTIIFHTACKKAAKKISK